MPSIRTQTGIGLFVLGALILAVIAIAVLGSGRWFSDSTRYVLYFQDSVSGLSVGAPVLFRGVKVGQVTDIKLMADTKDLEFHIPVIVEIKPFAVRPNGPSLALEQAMDELIAKGLRAQLTMQSFVTGQCQILLDFHPDTKVQTSGLSTTYPEIPTIPSSLQALTSTVSEIPLQDIAHKLTQVVDGLERLLGSPGLDRSMELLDQTLTHTSHLAARLDREVPPTLASVRDTMDSAQDVLQEAGKQIGRVSDSLVRAGDQASELMRTSKAKIGPMLTSLDQTFATAGATLEQTRVSLAQLSELLSRNSGLHRELLATLREIQDAARSVRTLGDYLERHPESLLRGKGR